MARMMNCCPQLPAASCRSKVYEAQVRRMLADPRASALVTGFAALAQCRRPQGRGTGSAPLSDVQRTDARDFSTEMELFLRSVLLDDSIMLLLGGVHSQ
jgi:hypothetical protein